PLNSALGVSHFPRSGELSFVRSRRLWSACPTFALQCGDQCIEDSFQILRALTEHPFNTVTMYGEFADLAGDTGINIDPYRPCPTNSGVGLSSEETRAKG